MKISVIVHPNSKKSKIENDLLGYLHIYVKEPPLNGKANSAVIESLASHFSTKKSNIFLIKGAKSKNKIFDIIVG